MRPPGSVTLQPSSFTATQSKQTVRENRKVGTSALVAATTAITIRGLFYLALALIECSKRQHEEGRGVRCYEADTATNEVLIGIVCVCVGTMFGIIANDNKI